MLVVVFIVVNNMNEIKMTKQRKKRYVYIYKQGIKTAKRESYPTFWNYLVSKGRVNPRVTRIHKEFNRKIWFLETHLSTMRTEGSFKVKWRIRLYNAYKLSGAFA